MQKPVRILQATVSNDGGGLTGYICNNCRFIDKNRVQFDFITYENQLDFEQEFLDMGAKFFRLPHPTHFLEYTNILKSLKEENNYTAIHFNMSYANIVPIIAARRAGFKRIIVHSHSTDIDEKRSNMRRAKQMAHRVWKQWLPSLATDYWACSELAAKWMFPDSLLKGQKVIIAKNAIDSSRYRYNEKVRAEMRKNLGLADSTICVGHIGRFSYQKNQSFVIDIFNELVKCHSDACLLLIGGKQNGESFFNEVKEKIAQFNLEKKVKILGVRHDVPQLMQAMDVFILPSRFEGMGNVGIEAQAAGLPSLFSIVIPKEMEITQKCYFMDVSLMAKEWAKKILEVSKDERSDTWQEFISSGYEITDEIEKVTNCYELMGYTVDE